MTVAELIAELQKLPQDSVALCRNNYWMHTGPISLEITPGIWCTGHTKYTGGTFFPDSYGPERESAMVEYPSQVRAFVIIED